MFVNALHIPVIMVIQLAVIHMALTELFPYRVNATSWFQRSLSQLVQFRRNKLFILIKQFSVSYFNKSYPQFFYLSVCTNCFIGSQ